MQQSNTSPQTALHPHVMIHWIKLWDDAINCCTTENRRSKTFIVMPPMKTWFDCCRVQKLGESSSCHDVVYMPYSFMSDLKDKSAGRVLWWDTMGCTVWGRVRAPRKVLGVPTLNSRVEGLKEATRTVSVQFMQVKLLWWCWHLVMLFILLWLLLESRWSVEKVLIDNYHSEKIKPVLDGHHFNGFPKHTMYNNEPQH